jgi:hypothetical protein
MIGSELVKYALLVRLPLGCMCVADRSHSFRHDKVEKKQ